MKIVDPMRAAPLSKRARDAIVESGVLDFADDGAAARLLAVHGCGCKTLGEIARAVERSFGIRLGGYERVKNGFSAKPTLTTEDAARELSVTPEKFVRAARAASVSPKPRRDGRVWSDWDSESIRRVLAGIRRQR